MAVLVVIDPGSSHADLLECLNNYNKKAAELSRRGYAATTPRHRLNSVTGKVEVLDPYGDLHDTCNALITAMETVSILGELERSI